MVGTLQQLASLDGEEITGNERERATARLSDLQKELQELNSNDARLVTNTYNFSSAAGAKINEEKQPWTPGTRIQDQR